LFLPVLFFLISLAFGVSRGLAVQVKLIPVAPSGNEIADAETTLQNGGIVAMQNVKPQIFGAIFNVGLASSSKPSDAGGSYCVIGAAYDQKHILRTYRGALVQSANPDAACMARFQKWADQLKAGGATTSDEGPSGGAWTPLSITTESETDSHGNELQVIYSVYRANSSYPDTDWYAVTQQTGSQPHYDQCKTLGYACGWLNSSRNLSLSATDLSGNNYSIFDHAPLQTNKSTTTTFTVGAEITDTSGGVSAGYEFSYTQSNVTTTDTTVLSQNIASWSDSFAGMSNWEHDDDPPAALKALWQSYQTAIFSVPVGTSAFQVHVNDSAKFTYINSPSSSSDSPADVVDTITVYAPTLAASPNPLALSPGQSGNLTVYAQILGRNTAALGWVITNPNTANNINISTPTGAGTEPISIEVPAGTPAETIYLSLNTTDQYASLETKSGPISIQINVVEPSSIQPGVLLTGGLDWASIALDSAEIWSPTSETSKPVGTMLHRRAFHTATPVINDRVFVAGGLGTDAYPMQQTELYDEASQTFLAGPNLQFARALHTATALNDGTVLIAGGDTDVTGTATVTAEIYNPVANTTTRVGNMGVGRMDHSATLLDTGNVLICGGTTTLEDPTYLSTCEIYYPDQKLFQSVDTSALAPYGFLPHAAATVSQGGNVIVVGDSKHSPDDNTASYSPASNVMGPIPGPKFTSNGLHSAMISLPGSEVMLIGGSQAPNSSGLWAYPAGAVASTQMSENRIDPQALYLQNTNTALDGHVVALGGVPLNTGSSNGTAVEVNDPNTNTWSDAGVLTTARSNTTATLILTPITPNLALTSSSNPATVGTSVVLTASLATSGRSSTGSIIFTVDGNATPVATVALQNGSASYSTSTLSIGSHTITATYDGGSGLLAANASLTQVITPNQVSATISGLIVPQPVSYGTPTVTLQGTVSGTASGTTIYPQAGQSVTINIGAATYNAPIGASGFFTYAFPLSTSTGVLLDGGTYPINYSYVGDSLLKPQQTSYGSLTINPVTSQFGPLSPPKPPIYAGSSSITASGSITAGAYYPTGNVSATIYQGSAAMSSASAPIQAKGSFSISVPAATLAAGPYTLVYSYVGTTDFTAVNSNALPFNIISVSTTTSLKASASSLLLGQTATFTATVAASSGLATGSVTFMDGSVALGTSPLNNGVAVFSTSSLAAGPHTIVAVYDATPPYLSSSASTPVSVSKMAASLSGLTSQSIPAGTSSISLSGTVASSGSVIPTGTVTVSVNGHSSMPVTLDQHGNFSLTFDTSSIPASARQYAITYTYSGDQVFNPVVDASTTLTINKDPSGFIGINASQTVPAGTQQALFAGKVLAQTGPTGITATTTAASGNEDTGVFFTGLNDSGLTSNSATFSVWIKTTTKALQMLLQGPEVNPAIYLQNDQITLAWAGPSGPTPTWTSADTTPVSDGQWHHIAVSLSDGAITFYKDGVATADKLSVSDVSNAADAFNLGGGAYNHIQSFVGSMWNGQVWAASKTTADIQAEMYLTLPNGDPALRLLTSFSDSGTATNLIGDSTARVKDVAMTSSTIPFIGQYPAASEQVALLLQDASGNVVAKQGANFGSSGSFSITVPTATLGSGTYQVNYSYEGNAILLAATASGALTLSKGASSTTVSSAPNPSAWGASVTFTATVTGTGGTPTGTVSFLQGGKIQQTPLVNCVATYSTSSLPVGTNSVTATYSGDSSFAGSSAMATQTVNKAAPAMKLTSSPNPSAQGHPVVFTVTVTGSGSTPTGTIAFSDGGTPLQTVPLVNGQASYSTSSLAAGTHTITALYSGDTTFVTSSTVTTQTVNQAATSDTALVSSPNPSAQGQQVTFTATITGSGGTPTGTVTFSLRGNTLKTVPLASGVAVYSTATLPVGANAVTATYGGDSNFATSNAVTTQTVNKAASNTALVSSPNPSAQGQQVTFTATVSGSGGTPTGTVAFSASGKTLNAVPLVNGLATYNTVMLPAGANAITATYTGDSNFATSNAVTTQTVNKAASNTALVSSPNPSAQGQQVTFTATVTASGGTPTGAVTFSTTGNTSKAIPLVNGVAVYSTATLAAGANAITATYSGDSNFATSSAVTTQTVIGKLQSQVTMTASPNPAGLGQVIVLTASVAQAGPVPTGNISFSETAGSSSYYYGNANLNSQGVATITVDPSNLQYQQKYLQSAGTHILYATYGGDTNYPAAASSSYSMVITSVSVPSAD
jgi:hypothetical protein